MDSFLVDLNYWALICSAVIFWIIGAIWFSLLFGNSWSMELGKIGIKIKNPSQKEMLTKFIVTFIYNLIVAFGVSYFVYMMNTQTLINAVLLGLGIGICFSGATICLAYLWESRSAKLTLIDIGYPIVGIIACSIIMTFWQ